MHQQINPNEIMQNRQTRASWVKLEIGKTWVDTKVLIDGKPAGLTRLSLDVEVQKPHELEFAGPKLEMVMHGGGNMYPVTIEGVLIPTHYFEEYQAFMKRQREIDQDREKDPLKKGILMAEAGEDNFVTMRRNKA